MKRLVVIASAVVSLSGTLAAETVSGANASTIPYPVFSAIHGRVIGWAQTGRSWFVVYLDRISSDPCGLDGASWRIALVDTAKRLVRVTADQRVGGAMCGNELAWVRAGRFSDGKHPEVAFMLWATPSIGARTYIYRIADGHLRRLATFDGDSVTLRRGTAIVAYENRGRSPRGEIEDTYKFEHGHYALVGRR